MKICERAFSPLQTVGYEGAVRLCCFMRDNIIGKLSKDSFYDIYHGKKARAIYHKLTGGGGWDNAYCSIDACPYLAMGTIDQHLIETDDLPEYPTAIELSHEEVCNYTCTFCTSRVTWRKEPPEIRQAGYENITEKLRPVLPHVKKISAHGRGELFTAKGILKTLSEWQPLAPASECSAALETNGSLFDEAHWKQIENLGQYDLRVAITVTSFDDYTYKLLSGTTLPVQQVIDNLHFVKSLREKGIINHLEIATVVQERNFWQMPEFARRCVEEFGADTVRLRPYIVHGSGDPVRDWFTDMRSATHPYREEYRKIMQDPIFQNPKVLDWGGGRDSQTRDIIWYLARKKPVQTLKALFSATWDYSTHKAKALWSRLRFGKM
ncbi:MAG: hypothetical protein IJS39_16870 [Synergistaceae bacterium]|nr:hypothetical protein [Synergistaceae bacterium]